MRQGLPFGSSSLLSRNSIDYAFRNRTWETADLVESFLFQFDPGICAALTHRIIIVERAPGTSGRAAPASGEAGPPLRHRAKRTPSLEFTLSKTAASLSDSRSMSSEILAPR